MTNMNRVAPENIGFAVVNRRFVSGGKTIMAGEELDRDFLLKMPQSNRDAMEDSRQIKIYPRVVARSSAKTPSASAEPAVVGELYLRATGVDEYDVIRGEIVATKLTKEAAQAVIASTAQPGETNAQAGSPDAANGKPARAKKPRKAAGSRRAKKGKRKASPRRAAAKPAATEAKPPAEEENGPI